MNLAIAIIESDSIFTGSRETSLLGAEELAQYLQNEFKGMPEEILVVANGGDCPVVLRHYVRGHDYDVR